MTVMTKLETALAGAKGLAADLKTFSLDTDDQTAKQMFNSLASNAENMAQMLENRVNYLKNQEPQYDQQQ
ncbi:DUF1657 domain-containing protein [Tissierella carlieri]|jgi:hypothetical protein|uniref:DUF1657 domain-containing protein n=2 Tax=Tissierella carlieri TaxID=689904 RepID=A0ABT1S546_9FIRM|nr:MULTISPECIES: DUF1657 domain-containing protein [Tissierella]MBU5310914.1 DUF1657 domain-containing protein [Tissierella carlieri]MCQ4921457.1 DUF1657 domain-containing protein [Tissierella carlieri]MDU5081596.1 DUF1657 domain-containing protein [Bacillota bacterium]OZV12683.1 hypothetical protein CIW83_07220 [Tissierella sp. P1]